jgi:hypothetical protein
MTLLGGALGMLVVGGAFVYNEGAVRVDVRERTRNGEHIYLVVPAVVLPVAARLVPRDKLKDARGKIRPWLPTLKAASEELARCPDGPLVEVDSNREHISKIGLFLSTWTRRRKRSTSLSHCKQRPTW